MKRIKVINGPNLNMLGRRDRKAYGTFSLEDLNLGITEHARRIRVETVLFQSNHEGEIIEEIHGCMDGFDALIINPGALTHYSYAVRDAIEMLEIPVIEVHISNIHSREEFRNNSVVSAVCTGTVTGLGKAGYVLALDYLSKDWE